MKAIVYTGQGIFTGALTTAGAFLAMAFTNFKGIQEMGIICGGGLLVCLIPMMTMLPVLLLKGRQNVIDHDEGDIAERRARIENLWLKRPVLVTCVTVALCAVAATQLPKVYFDYDLLHMQSAGLPAVEFEKKLLNSADKSVLFGAVTATNQQDANALNAAAAARDAAKVSLDLAQTQFQSGYAGYLPFLTASQTYQQALMTLVQAEANRYADTAALFQALGGGWWHRADLSKN